MIHQSRTDSPRAARNKLSLSLSPSRGFSAPQYCQGVTLIALVTGPYVSACAVGMGEEVSVIPSLHTRACCVCQVYALYFIEARLSSRTREIRIAAGRRERRGPESGSLRKSERIAAAPRAGRGRAQSRAGVGIFFAGVCLYFAERVGKWVSNAMGGDCDGRFFSLGD